MKKHRKLFLVILLLIAIVCVYYYCTNFHAERANPDPDLKEIGEINDIWRYPLNIPMDMDKMPVSGSFMEGTSWAIEDYPCDLSRIVEAIKSVDSSFDEQKYRLVVGSDGHSNPTYEMYFTYFIDNTIITNKSYVVTVFENNAMYMKGPNLLRRSNKNSLENEKSLMDLVDEFKLSKEYLNFEKDYSTGHLKSREEYFYYDYYEDSLYYSIMLDYYEDIPDTGSQIYLRGEDPLV